MGGEEIAVEQISAELSANHEFQSILFDSQDWAMETGVLSRFRQFLSMVWNPKSIRMVRTQIEDFKPDVILLHNIMPIGSAGLLFYLTRCGVPTVQYIHNFRPFSVNGYCWGKGKLLPQGLKQNFLPEILAASWQNSLFKTGWYGILIWLLHRVGVYRRIDAWIAISGFMKDSFVTAGIDESRIRVISHSWHPQNTAEQARFHASDPDFLFLGRLTEEKGLRVLLDAWELFEESSPVGRLVIAGDGPMKDEVRNRCERMRRATYVGFQGGEDKKQLLVNCTALVVPSIWWEPSGLVLYEAYDYGKPVIAARSGGIVDHVEDGVTGWIHEPGNVRQLAAQIREASLDVETCRARGENGRRYLLKRSASSWIHDFNDFVGKTIARTDGEARKLPQTTEPTTHPTQSSGKNPDAVLRVQVYLADQNPGHDRSFGISRMSHVILETLLTSGRVEIAAITSRSSQQAPAGMTANRTLPWGTRRKWGRMLTDHFHPLFTQSGFVPDLYYFPKGYLPFLSGFCRPSVVTIHDTIIQYDEDHYPKWRKDREYAYWAMMLKHTLRHADLILTVSESSKEQILTYMKRHGIPNKEIHVTYEPSLYERIPQPEVQIKENFVVHLASSEPHKRTAHLIRWWHQAEAMGKDLPMLHLIGTVPTEVEALLASSNSIVKRPFLEEAALQAAYRAAKALVLPSEIEGFGLPALEAYYLGTPVCFVRGTSVEEILHVATDQGGFSLDDPNSLFSALDEVLAMTPDEVRNCGLKLRETYAADKVAARMIAVFDEVKNREC